MNKKNILLVLLLLNISFFNSCTKNTAFEKYDLLTDRPWTLEKVVLDGVVDSDTCQYDDHYIFSEKKYKIENGVILCNPDGEFKEAKWKFIDDGNGLKMNLNFVTNDNTGGYNTYEKFDIVTLNDSVFVLSSQNFDKYKYFNR